MAKIERLISRRLSFFRTQHEFVNFGEFSTVSEYLEYREWAQKNRIPLFILGNGSNTLFIRRRVRSLVLLNKLEGYFRDLGNGRVEASSSLPLIRILKYCETKSLDSFYFLSSVPATVGGALAMNAGGGVGPTIYDYVESLSYLEEDKPVILTNAEVERKHRHTMFTGIQDRLIISAIFKFRKKENKEAESEIKKRIAWSRQHQDLKYSNCGSVFREYDDFIVRSFRRFPPFGIHLPFFRTQFSRKTSNWINCDGTASWPIVFIIRLVQAVHVVAGKRAVTEVIEVE